MAGLQRSAGETVGLIGWTTKAQAPEHIHQVVDDHFIVPLVQLVEFRNTPHRLYKGQQSSLLAVDGEPAAKQVIEKRPTFGYEGRFGKETGAWTTEMFIEAVYKSLKDNS